MVDIITIEKINDFVEKKCPDLSSSEKFYCFSKLYSSFGSMTYDKNNEELMINLLNGCLQEVRKQDRKKERVSIWQPRYKDNICLIAKYKVPDNDFEVVFTKATHLDGMIFEINGTWIKQNCTLDTNGKIPCYAVPMEKLYERHVANLENTQTPMNMER